MDRDELEHRPRRDDRRAHEAQKVAKHTAARADALQKLREAKAALQALKKK